MIQPLLKLIQRFLKLETELSHDPAISFLSIHLKKMKALIEKDTCTSMFKAALFTLFITFKIWKQLSVHQQINE